MRLRELRLRPLLVGLLATLLLGSAALRGGYGPTAYPPGPRREVVAPEDLVVLDGDTFRLGSRTLRLLGADTPESAAPWFDGDQEPWASLATERVRLELARARRVELVGLGIRGVYERELVHVVVDGRPLAAILVEAGLAYPTVRRYGDLGFPDYALEIVRVARPPPFEPPWRWRSAHRRDEPVSLALPAASKAE